MTRPVVIPVRLDPTGQRGPTPGAARGPRWRTSSHGFRVPALVDGTSVDQRAVEAAAALQDDYGGVTGWAGLGWLSPRWFDGTPWGGGPARPVTLAVGGNRWTRQQKYFETSEERLAPADLIVVDGLRITTPVRSALFEMRYARNARDAAITLSMACYDDLVSIDEAAAYAATLNGWTGIPKAREALGLASENAWSPREVALGHVWMVDAELPQVRYNCPVFDLGGRLIATPDVLDPVAGVYGQYDSALHLTASSRAVDVERDEALLRHGLEGAIMLAGDVADPTAFIGRLRAAYDRAADKPAGRRRWTIEQPSWWIDTTTVAARRALTPALRARLLAHRAA